MATPTGSSEQFTHEHHPREKYGGPKDHPSDFGWDVAAAMEWKTMPDSWFVPASDSHSASERLVIQVPPQMMAALAAVRDAPNSPYNSIQEVVRHAMHRHLNWSVNVFPEMNNSFLGVLNMVVKATRDRALKDRAHEVLSEFVGQIKELLAEGEYDEASFRVWEFREHVQDLDEGPSRRKALKILHEELGHIIPKERPVDVSG